MTENVNGPTGNETPSNETSSKSGETNNNTSNELFDKGYGKGKSKGKAEVLKELGVEDIETVKSALKFEADRREEEKSTADKLAEMTSKFETTESELKAYRETANAEATTLFESLSDDNKSAIEASGLPIEKMVPVMRQMTAAPPAPKKVGASVNPPSESVEEKLNEFKTKSGLNPEYRKDPVAYFEKRLAAFNKKEAGEE